MKFTATPESLLSLLNQVGKSLPKRKRENSLITFSVSKNRITVLCTGIIAGLELPVQGRGQFAVNWKAFTKLLALYPKKTPVQMECTGERLQIDSFSLPVHNYQSEPVPDKASIPPAEPVKKSKKPETGPQRTASPDGYSPPPPYRDDNDATGAPGMVSAEDFTGQREPVTCPVCKQVGYYEKHTYSGGTYHAQRRTWVAAREALNRVILTGKEDSVLCPSCLEVRLHANKNITPITGAQTDLFDQR